MFLRIPLFLAGFYHIDATPMSYVCIVATLKVYVKSLKGKKMKKPTTQSHKLGDDNLMQYIEQIITEMKGNEVLFPNPVPALIVIETALAAFRLSATEAAYRDTRAVKIRKGKRKELVYQLRELSKYVDTIAKKDVNVILAAGFVPSKDAESYAGYIPKATRLVAKPQEIGSSRIKLKVDRWEGARMYQFEFRKKGVDTVWAIQLSSKSTCLLERLERFEEYEFRVTYIGINPKPNYSDIVSSYVV